MSIQLQGNSDSVFSNDVIAPNIPTQGQIVGYQQGLWTPSPDLGTMGELLADRNTWTRIGNTIMLNGYVSRLTDKTGNAIRIIGLPYVPFGQPCGTASSSFVGTPVGGISLCYTNYNSDNLRSEIIFLTTSPDKGNGWATPTYNEAGTNMAIYFALNFLTEDTTWQPINGATVS